MSHASTSALAVSLSPARLLYLFLLGFSVGFLANEVQTFLTSGPGALYDDG